MTLTRKIDGTPCPAACLKQVQRERCACRDTLPTVRETQYVLHV